MMKVSYDTENRKLPKVTVIVPVYNGQEYIVQAIRSVLAQSWKETMELIIIDDCSSDETAKVVKEFIADRNHSQCRISYCRNDRNLGVAECRNKGIRMAQSPYVAFLDADDWWDVYKLEKQFRIIEQSGCVLCATGRELMTPEGKSTGKMIGIPERITYKQLLKTNAIPCSSVVMRTEVAREFYMCRDDLHEDYILWLKVLQKYKFAIGIDEPLLKSRLSRGGKSRNKLKSAKMQFGVYRYFGFGILRSAYYFCNYAIHGFIKYH